MTAIASSGAGKKCPQGHICLHAHRHCITQQTIERHNRFYVISSKWVTNTLLHNLSSRPIRTRLRQFPPSAPPWHAQQMGRKQLEYSMINRIWRWKVVMPHEERQRATVNFAAPSRMRLERFQFGSEQECITHPSVIQRLLAEAITRKMQYVFLLVPQTERKHPIESRKRIFHSPHIECGKHHLGIGMSFPSRRSVLFFQFFPQFTVIIYLAIKSNNIPPAV